MSVTIRAIGHGVIAMAAALGIVRGACAQSEQPGPTGATAESSARSSKSFIDVAVGKSTYGTDCGVAGLTCSHSTTSYSITAGNMFTRNLGIELSGMNLGKISRAGGSVIARGINLSAVGRIPLGDNFGVEAKIGTTYGVTHVSTAVDSGLPSGRDSGFGLGYGVALDVNMPHGIHGALGWGQHDFHFAGQGTSKVKNVTLALGYTF